MTGRLSQVIQALELVQPVAEAVPGVGGLIGAAVELAVKIARLTEDAKVLKDDFYELGERSSRITLAVLEVIKNADDAYIPMLESRTLGLIRTLDACLSAAQKAGALSRLKRIVGIGKLRAELGACQKQLDEAVMVFGIQSHIINDLRLSELTTVTLRADRGIAGVAQDISVIKNHIYSQGDYDGEFQYFRLCDFEILDTFDRHNHANTSREYHLVRRQGTQEKYLMKRYHADDGAAIRAVQCLKYVRHVRLEQLIGYSRPESEAPFYLVKSGHVPFHDVALSYNTRDRIKLVLDSVQQIESIANFLGRHVYKDVEVTYNAFSMEMSIYRTGVGSEDISLLPWMTADGRLNIEFPESGQELEYADHARRRPLFGDRAGRLYVEPLSHSNAEQYQMPRDIGKWLQLLDSRLVLYIASSHSPWRQWPTSRTLGHVEDNIFRTICVIDMESHSVNGGYSNIQWQRNQGDPVQGDSQAKDSRTASTQDPASGHWRCPFVDLEFITLSSHSIILGSTWRNLAEVVNTVPCPVELCILDRVTDKLYCSITCNSDGDSEGYSSHPTLPEVLYFFMSPTDLIGPLHIMPGYWALDEAGQLTSTIKSCAWDPSTRQWCIECDLEGYTLTVTRTITVWYARFSQDEIDMILELQPQNGRIEEVDQPQ